MHFHVSLIEIFGLKKKKIIKFQPYQKIQNHKITVTILVKPLSFSGDEECVSDCVFHVLCWWKFSNWKLSTIVELKWIDDEDDDDEAGEG